MAENEEQLAAPSKEQLEQEKQLLLAFKPVMQKFLHDHTELQVSALYALQVHCNASTFPKGTRSHPHLAHALHAVCSPTTRWCQRSNSTVAFESRIHVLDVTLTRTFTIFISVFLFVIFLKLNSQQTFI